MRVFRLQPRSFCLLSPARQQTRCRGQQASRAGAPCHASCRARPGRAPTPSAAPPAAAGAASRGRRSLPAGNGGRLPRQRREERGLGFSLLFGSPGRFSSSSSSPPDMRLPRSSGGVKGVFEKENQAQGRLLTLPLLLPFSPCLSDSCSRFAMMEHPLVFLFFHSHLWYGPTLPIIAAQDGRFRTSGRVQDVLTIWPS